MRLRRIVITGVAAGALALTACGDDSGDGDRNDYPASIERAFLQACERTSNGKPASCKCLLDEVQKRMTFAEFKRDSTAIGRGGGPSRKFRDAVAECR